MRGRVLEEEEFLRRVRFRVRHVERERDNGKLAAAFCSLAQGIAKS